jgi:glycosyltransferase involved in cell wall biosynthesis
VSIRVAALLPHLGLYGGNLRYIELGNALVERGVDFALATPEGVRPGFAAFSGRAVTHDALRESPPDVLLASEQDLLERFREHPAGLKLFYFILERTAREKEIVRTPGVTFLANSSGLARRLERKYGVPVRRVIGGVNPALFRPLHPEEREPRAAGSFRVIANGRISRRRKGTAIVARAVDGLARSRPGMELDLFDTATLGHRPGLPEGFRCRAVTRLRLDVPRDRLRLLYGSGDLFVSAEKKAGWSNTTIEAMACGIPVVCTASGTTDFARHEETALVVRRNRWSVRRAIRRLMEDPALRDRLAAAGLAEAREFTWSRTADTLLEVVRAE